MENYIIIGFLLMMLVLSILRVGKHFRGGCCGSGSTTIRDKKTLKEPVIGEKLLDIQGMHCENCRNRVENALNRLPGVVGKVDLKKKTATVTFSRKVADRELREAVEKLGFRVTCITKTK